MQQGTGGEWLEVEGSEIERPPCLGIRIEQDLESPIDLESLHDIGCDAPSDVSARLEQQAWHAVRLQGACRREPGEPGSDDDHVWSLRHDGMDNSFPTP